MPRNITRTYTLFAAAVFLVLMSSFGLSQALITPVMPQPGQPALLYSNQTQDDLKLLFLHAIEQAEDSIYLVVYSLRDPKITKALRKKSEAGVEVTVICDGNASKGIKKKLGNKVNTSYRNEKGIMHQKILIADHSYVWIGSANFTSESLGMHGNLVTGMHSPELAIWLRENHDKEMLNKTFSIGGQRAEIWLTRQNQASVDRLIRMISSAEKSARVAMFTWTRQDMVDALSNAQLRGVKIGVVLDRNSSQGAGKKVTQLLKGKKIPTTMNTGNGLLHHKMMLIDDKVLVNGSANWTKAAFTDNTDCYLILHDLTKKQNSKLNKLWRILTLESREIP